MSVLFTYLFFLSILAGSSGRNWALLQTQNLPFLVVAIIFYNLGHKVVAVPFLTTTIYF